MQAQIVHEAEVHRQHVRLKIPITIEIDGTRYSVDDWSMGGFGVSEEITSRQAGERFPVRLLFPFEDFEVALRAECQLVYVVESARRFGCRFVSLTRGQAALFRYLIDAYLSGEIVSGDDVLAVAGRGDGAESRAALLASPYEEPGLGSRLRRVLGYALGALAAVALAGLIWLGIEGRFLRVEAQNAIIEAPSYRLRVPISGLVDPAEIEGILQPGGVVATVRSPDGSSATLTSPCECDLRDWLVLPGQYAAVGEAVAVLVAVDQPLTVQASVPFDQAERLRTGDVVEIVVPGLEEAMRGQIDRIDFRASAADLAARSEDAALPLSVRVVIRPDRPFDYDLLGTLVRIRFI